VCVCVIEKRNALRCLRQERRKVSSVNVNNGAVSLAVLIPKGGVVSSVPTVKGFFVITYNSLVM